MTNLDLMIRACVFAVLLWHLSCLVGRVAGGILARPEKRKSPCPPARDARAFGLRGAGARVGLPKRNDLYTC